MTVVPTNSAPDPAHVLIVHEDYEDGFDVVHPRLCPYWMDRDVFSGAPVTEYTCLAGVEHQEGTLSDYFRHLLDPWVDERFDSREPLAPGTYWLWMDVFKSRCWDCWDGYDYEIEVWAAPQPALTATRM